MSAIKEYVDEKFASGEVSIVTIAEGAGVEMFDQAIAKVTADCADVNTAPKAKRTVTLKLTVEPSSDRTILTYDIDVAIKLAGMAPASGSADLIRVSGRGVVAKQRGNAQMDIFDNIAPFQKKEEK
jgi:hypothetical protein